MYQIVEEESGTNVSRQHPHNRYYAGYFSAVPIQPPHLSNLSIVKEYAA